MILTHDNGWTLIDDLFGYRKFSFDRESWLAWRIRGKRPIVFDGALQGINMNERALSQASIAGYIPCSTSAFWWQPIPGENDQITMIDEPFAGSKVGIIRTGIGWKLVKSLSAMQKLLIDLARFTRWENSFIVRAGNDGFKGDTLFQGGLDE